MTQQQSPNARRIFVVIHGHFYQPPRKNPWTNAIPRQESTRPFHDWNERITAECYAPNTRSRALNPDGEVVNIINNFEYINFNIGPTLFSWLEEQHPETYQRILEADHKSCTRRHGHGNAIAQVYNHLIMPLANERDKLTQVLWGMRDFQFRFGRDAESIWLAETAVNEDTVRCLIDQGIRYIILSPTQAQQVRRIGETDWHDVSDGSIDTTQPYRIFLKSEEQGTRSEEQGTRSKGQGERSKERGALKYLDVFFYDGALSVDVSFHHLLRDADTFTQRLYASAAKSQTEQVLVHICTDGEIYGHHEPFADMCLAAAVTSKFQALGMEVTNYGQYLEMFPPTMEVRLKPGSETGEGTAWSCSHGVGRWYRDCGCSIANNPGWNQRWRTPLRRAFDVLRDALAEVYEHSTHDLLRECWAARNEYIECLLDPSPHTIDAFLEKHSLHPLDEEEQSIVLRLLEAQKYSLFTYTSCAWFFDDLSGLEILQNMRYAAKAIQLTEELTPQNLEMLLLKELALAHSNIPGFGSGQDIYLQKVKPDVYTPERAVNQYLLQNFFKQAFLNSPEAFLKNERQGQERQIYVYRLHCDEYVVWSYAEYSAQHFDEQPRTFYSGLIRIQDTITRQRWRLLFVSFLESGEQPVSYLKRIRNDAEFHTFKTSLPAFIPSSSEIKSSSLQSLTVFLEESGCTAYRLDDLYEEDLECLFHAMARPGIERLEHHLHAIYEDSRAFLDRLGRMNIRLPKELRPPVEFALSHRLRKETRKLERGKEALPLPSYLGSELEELLQLSQIHHLYLDQSVLQNRLSDLLVAHTQTLARALNPFLQRPATASAHTYQKIVPIFDEMIELLQKAEKLGVTLDMTTPQNIAFDIFEQAVLPWLRAAAPVFPQNTEYDATFSGKTRVNESPSSGVYDQCIQKFFTLLRYLNMNIGDTGKETGEAPS